MGNARRYARRLGARTSTLPVVTTAADVQKLDWLFYVGSAQSFDPRGQKIARAFVAVMRAAQVRIGILGARRDLDRRMRAARRATKCCSRRSRRISWRR